MSNSKPIVGIVARPEREDNYNVLSVMESYRKAIVESGANPILLLPPQLVEYNEYKPKEISPLTETEKNMIIDQINLCNGILIPGGGKRYEYDRFVVNYCLNKDIPVLGICLGMQLLATHANKDTLKFIDDDYSHLKNGVNNAHRVRINRNSRLFEILKEEEFVVNSRHSFQVTETGDFKVVGYSFDGVIEAIEDNSKEFAIGVQWHPEGLMDTDHSKRLFKSFVKSCKR